MLTHLLSHPWKDPGKPLILISLQTFVQPTNPHEECIPFCDSNPNHPHQLAPMKGPTIYILYSNRDTAKSIDFKNVLLGKPTQIDVKQKSVPSKIAQPRDQLEEKTIFFANALYNTSDYIVARFILIVFEPWYLSNDKITNLSFLGQYSLLLQY